MGIIVTLSLVSCPSSSSSSPSPSPSDKDTPQGPIEKITGVNLALTNEEAGSLGVAWTILKTNLIIGYNVFYWVGAAVPEEPQHIAEEGETNVVFTNLQPNTYNVRVDVLSSYPGQEVVTGDTKSIIIYGKPLPAENLEVDFSRGSFTNIADKLYAVGYPLTYAEADTPAEAGGSLSDVSYLYRYQVEGGDWVGYNEVMGEAMISLQVDDLSDPTVVKAGYGKKYQVELIASNVRGFISDVASLEFIYKSFPEPFMQSNNLVVKIGDRNLEVTWPDVVETNGSTVASYTVILSDDPYGSPLKVVNVLESESDRRVVFDKDDGLVNNQPYIITVIPHGAVTGSILNALSVVTGYNANDVIEKGSQEEVILSAYTGTPELYRPQGAPEAVANLVVVSGDNSATVNWDAPSTGSPATKYVVEYLASIADLITNITISKDDGDAELSGLSWEGATSIEVTNNDSGRYSQIVSGLNVLSATNVFRVRAIRIDDSGKEWLGAYRYYALGVDPSLPPSSVGEISFSYPWVSTLGSYFTVNWNEPDDPGEARDGSPAQLAGYKVSWGTTAAVDEGSAVITDPKKLFYKIEGLTPGTRYYVRVQAKNNNAAGNIYNTGSNTNTYTVKAPGAVLGVVYSEHTTSSFRVKWSDVETGYGPEGQFPANKYEIELSGDQGVSWRKINRENLFAIEEVITGLIPGTSYKVRVKSFNTIFINNRALDIITSDDLYGDAAEGVETWTRSLPMQVESLVVSDPSYSGSGNQAGFKVSWTPPSDTGLTATGNVAAITGYDVAYAEWVGGVLGEYVLVAHEGTVTERVFTDFKTNTEYDIRIRAINEAGAGVGAHISGWTPSLPEAVDPNSIVFSLATASTIRIAWAAPKPGRDGGSSSNDIVTTYKVEIAPEGGQYSTIQDGYSGNIITATNLNNSTSYRARITAKNKWGEAGASISSSSGTTLAQDPTPPSAVGPLQVNSFTDTQVVFSWTAPASMGTTDGVNAATLSGYVVKYKTADSGFIEIDEQSEGVRLATALTGTTATVTGLGGNTTYTFLVVAINSGNAIGLDVDAPTVEQTTAVSPPENLRQSQPCVKTTSVGLTWDASFGATSYKLYRNNIEIAGSIATTSYTDTGLTPNTAYTYKVRACKGTVCLGGDSTPLTIATLREKSFKSIIDSEMIPADLTDYDARSREIFSYYNGGTSIVAKYVKPDGSRGGSSFINAAGNPKNIIDGITDASADKVYVVLLSGGTYTPDTMEMKNNVAIVGGVDECLGFSDTPTTLDGEGARQLIENLSVDNTALLYGVTITDGFGKYGGGMDNNYSSPILVGVTFSGNTADFSGGGMHNYRSSPILVGVTFSGNTANNGGGMYNGSKSSPSLVGVTFSGNTADQGGGMYNDIVEDNESEDGPLVINSIFWGNTSTVAGPQFYFENDGASGQENLRIYNSIVQGGTGNLVSGTSYTIVNQGGFGSGSSDSTGAGVSPILISFADISTTDPGLGPLANNGGSVLTHAISRTSSAVNQGLYVRKAGSTFYYSKDSTTWYTKPDLSGEEVADLANAQYLSVIDATGYARTARPDLGAYEAR